MRTAAAELEKPSNKKIPAIEAPGITFDSTIIHPGSIMLKWWEWLQQDRRLALELICSLAVIHNLIGVII